MAGIILNNAHSLLIGSSVGGTTAVAGSVAGAASFMYADARWNFVGDVRRFGRDLGLLSHANKQLSANRNHGLYTFIDTAKRLPKKVCIRNHDMREWNYEEFNKITTRLANYLLQQGHQPGETAGLMLENNAQLCMAIVGVLKARYAMAPQNTNLRGAALLHCIKIASSKSFIFESTFVDAVREIAPDLRNAGIKLYFWTQSDDVPGLTEEAPDFEVDGFISEKRLKEFGPSLEAFEPIAKIMKETQPTDTSYIIYTSGTTGLPKGGQRDHFALIAAAGPTGPIAGLMPLESDTHMGATPLYHAQAFTPFIMCISRGATFVPLRKFSASRFWEQCIQYKVTTFWYLGELCRYLLAQPPRPTDKLHSVRRISGAGLRKEIFKEFYDRFGLETIVEFFAASDGTSYIVNEYHGGVVGIGSLGRRGPIQRLLPGPQLIKVDQETEEPIRDPSTGLCIPCGPNEPGDCLGPYNPERPGQPSYKNNEGATNKKVVRDVFAKGDAWWRMGDLIMRDNEGWYWFCDRIGDTFRWKAENVSTQEVGNLLAEMKAIQEANVYGVPVPANDGNAGMAALVIHEDYVNKPVDDIVKDLATHALKVLPRYAVPVFVRILPAMEITGTFKHRKVEYRKEGFKAADYWMPPGNNTYVRMTNADKNKLAAGQAKL
ncbi:acetyl-CoA synthetase-like protein [Gonapodya prolifera JEL478]|uniref:Acetyl-CoA synthetase-like protein n=1 Tax=Gonapodya prolifera (strain JEL478) TaxID=1344416 RepID=A0A139AU76_GONPJ|nr:acetyl-CoA synthetase-like protein [Gonapodya prolifera JEL478]|eukprot:KXS20290.1 acetyl-CoA synthetase-like protein [Gonapodya prolifera JEL478]